MSHTNTAIAYMNKQFGKGARLRIARMSGFELNQMGERIEREERKKMNAGYRPGQRRGGDGRWSGGGGGEGRGGESAASRADGFSKSPKKRSKGPEDELYPKYKRPGKKAKRRKSFTSIKMEDAVKKAGGLEKLKEKYKYAEDAVDAIIAAEEALTDKAFDDYEEVGEIGINQKWDWLYNHFESDPDYED